jgi:hypothetical protein
MGMGITWGFAWSLVGMLPRWILGYKPDAPFPIIFGVIGFTAGIIFSTIIAIAERRRTFEQISIPRFAAWGAAGGLLLSAIFSKAASLGAADILAIVPTFAIACAACASGSLALARRGAPRELHGGRVEDSPRLP